MKNFKSFLILAFCSVLFHTLIFNKPVKAQVVIDLNQSIQNSAVEKLPFSVFNQPVATFEQFVIGCSIDNNSSQFIVTGTGGIPPSPTESLRSTAIDTNTFDSVTTKQNQNTVQSQVIVEAQGWVVNKRGNVVLTVNSNNANPAANFQPATSDCTQP